MIKQTQSRKTTRKSIMKGGWQKLCHNTNSLYIKKIKCKCKMLTTNGKNCHIVQIGRSTLVDSMLPKVYNTRIELIVQLTSIFEVVCIKHTQSYWMGYSQLIQWGF